MRGASYLRLSLWEMRGNRRQLFFLVVCLSIGVGALVAVSGLSSALEGALYADAREFLAADIAVEARRAVPPEAAALLKALPGARTAETWEFPSLAYLGGFAGLPSRSLLVAVKAVEGPYPLYGALSISPSAPLSSLLDERSAVVAPEVLRRLGLRVGDSFLLGGKPFSVRGTLSREPDRLTLDLSRGPRVLVSKAGLERSGLSSRAPQLRHRVLAAVPASASARVEEAARRLRALFRESEGVRVETWQDAQPDLRRALRRTTPYLTLTALLSLLVGGVGVAQILRVWLAGRMDSIAVLRCLGLRPDAVVGLFAGQVLVLSLLAGAVGAGLGQGIQWAAARGIRASAGLSVAGWQPAAQVRGIGFGVGAALLFGLPALLSLRRVPPQRVFRREAEPLPLGSWGRLGQGLALGVGLFLTAWLQSGSVRLGLAFCAGLLAAVGGLALAASSLTWLLGLIASRLTRGPFWLRQGLRAAARGRRATVGTVVALGLGVLLLTAMSVLQKGLQEQLRGDLPRSAPSVLLFDIGEDQWPSLRSFLEREGATRLTSHPVFLARLRAVDGEPVDRRAARVGDSPERRWALTREQRLTVFPRLPDHESLSGTLWGDPSRPEVSVEEAFARDVGARVGSLLSFDVGGRPLDLAVTSLRRVEWKAMVLHFFLAAEPGTLTGPPDFRAAEVRLPPGTEQRVQDLLAASFPGVTLVQARDMLDRVSHAVERAGLGVRFLGVFTAVAGLAILGAGVAAGSVRRARDTALLRALGLAPRQVALTLAAEFGLTGLLAGTLGVAGGAAAGCAALARGLQIEWRPPGGPLALAVLASTALTAAVGVAVCLPSLFRSVQDALRAE